MKKVLLLASALLVAGSSFALVRDGAEYESVTIGENTYTLTNRWIFDRNHDGTLFGANDSPLGQSTSYRTACIYGDYVLVAGWPQGSTIVDGEPVSINPATILKYSIIDGSFIESIQLTLNGEIHQGTGVVNQIGCDDFGNVWVADMCFDINSSGIKVYTVDLESGALTALPEIYPMGITGEAAGSGAARMDYCHVVGDITGAEGPACLMCVFNSDNRHVLRARLDQGAEEWAGDFEDYFFLEPDQITETCPMITDEATGAQSPQASWGTAPVTCIIKTGIYNGDAESCNQFYVDGFTTNPTIYGTSGMMIDGFAKAPELQPSSVSSNGVAEFAIGSDNFVVYTTQQYDKDPGCQARIACFGEGFDYQDLTLCWDFPEDGLGTTSDGGTRMHNLMATTVTDENGKDAVYILDFKCYNGLAVYVVAPEDFVDPNELPDYEKVGGVENIAIDNSDAPEVYYNLQGVKVANPSNGLYIVKKGNQVSKQIIRK